MAAFKDIKVKVIFTLAGIIVTSMVIGFPKANANRIRENEIATEVKFEKNNEEHKEITAERVKGDREIRKNISSILRLQATQVERQTNQGTMLVNHGKILERIEAKL